MYLFTIIYLIMGLAILLVFMRDELNDNYVELGFLQSVIALFILTILAPIMFTYGIILGIVDGFKNQEKES